MESFHFGILPFLSCTLLVLLQEFRRLLALAFLVKCGRVFRNLEASPSGCPTHTFFPVRAIPASFFVEGVNKNPTWLAVFLLGFARFFHRPVSDPAEPFVTVLVVGKQVFIYMVDDAADRDYAFYLFLL